MWTRSKSSLPWVGAGLHFFCYILPLYHHYYFIYVFCIVYLYLFVYILSIVCVGILSLTIMEIPQTIQLNYCTMADLNSVPGFEPDVVRRIFQHRRQYDITPRCLETIPGLQVPDYIWPMLDFKPNLDQKDP